MAEIKKVTKKTENPYVNLYELDTLNRKGNPGKYYVASRAKSIQTLELTTGSQHSDGVIIYSLYGENHDKVVLVRQYRYAINGYIYELPAGLVEPGEDYHTSAVREMKEETGLDLHPLPVKNLLLRREPCCAPYPPTLKACFISVLTTEMGFSLLK